MQILGVCFRSTIMCRISCSIQQSSCYTCYTVWWHIVATCILKYWNDSVISERFWNFRTIPKCRNASETLDRFWNLLTYCNRLYTAI